MSSTFIFNGPVILKRKKDQEEDESIKHSKQQIDVVLAKCKKGLPDCNACQVEQAILKIIFVRDGIINQLNRFPIKDWDLKPNSHSVIFGVGYFSTDHYNGEKLHLVAPWFGAADQDGNPIYFLGQSRNWQQFGCQPLWNKITPDCQGNFFMLCPSRHGYNTTWDYHVSFEPKTQERIWKAIANQDQSEIEFLKEKLNVCCLKKNFMFEDGEENANRVKKIDDCNSEEYRAELEKNGKSFDLLWKFVGDNNNVNNLTKAEKEDEKDPRSILQKLRNDLSLFNKKHCELIDFIEILCEHPEWTDAETEAAKLISSKKYYQSSYVLFPGEGNFKLGPNTLNLLLDQLSKIPIRKL